MTKDVLITISGIQMMDEEDSDVEMIVRGDYYQKNGKHYILYDEVMEGFEGKVKNVIKISPVGMDIIKKGIANTHMQFEKNKKNMSYYNTPFGSLLVGINAKDVRVNETEEAIDIQVDYDLEVNYEHMAKCTINMNILPRDTTNFSI